MPEPTRVYHGVITRATHIADVCMAHHNVIRGLFFDPAYFDHHSGSAPVHVGMVVRVVGKPALPDNPNSPITVESFREADPEDHPITSVVPVYSAATARVLAERRQQISRWPAAHDDDHTDNSLLSAAMAYLQITLDPFATAEAEQSWPDSWEPDYFKPGEPERNMEKAAALIMAELDRRARARVHAAAYEARNPQ